MQPQGLAPINPDYFANMNAQIGLCNTCAELQVLVTTICTDLSAFVDAANSQILELTPLVALIENPPTNPITWISDFTSFFLKPYITPYVTYTAQLGQIATQYTQLVSTITQVAARLDCTDVIIPALPGFLIPGGSGAQIIPLKNGHGTWDGGSPPKNVQIINGGSGYVSPKVIAYYPLPSGPVSLPAVVTLTGGVITNVVFPALPDGSKPAIGSVTIAITDLNPATSVTAPPLPLGSNTAPGVVQGDGTTITIDPATGIASTVGGLAWQPQGSWQFPLGTPNNEIFNLPTKTGYKLLAGLPGSIVRMADNPPAADWTATWYADATPIGSVTVPAGLTDGVITFSADYNFTGEQFKFIAPATADGSAQGLSFLISGTRTS